MLQDPDAPTIMVLDWLMPRLDGVEICRRIRAHPQLSSVYIILLASRAAVEDVVHGLEAGANDRHEPFDAAELRARMQVGVRVVNLQTMLADAFARSRRRCRGSNNCRGSSRFAATARRSVTTQNYWHQVESYVGKHTDARFSHGICPECTENFASNSPASASCFLARSREASICGTLIQSVERRGAGGLGCRGSQAAQFRH